MIYFDNAATSWPKPPETTLAVIDAIETCGNPSRGAHPFAMAAARRIERARQLAAELFGCPGAERVAFTKNATEALNIAIGSVDGHIVTSEAEHNSVLRPLYKRGDFDIVQVDALGCYSPDDVFARCRPDTRAVVLAHASNLTGAVAPVREVGEICRERGILFIVDAAQTAGLVDIDMERLGIDALCFTGHKALYGIQGTGGICLGRRFQPRPIMTGGSGTDTFNTGQPPTLPSLLESGTANSHGLASLLAGMEYVKKHGPGTLRKQADLLIERFLDGLTDVPGVWLVGGYANANGGERLPIVSLNLGRLDSADVAAELADEYGIAVRAGAHCAPLLHRRFGTERQGAVRFSFSHFNTEQEIEETLSALKVISRQNP